VLVDDQGQVLLLLLEIQEEVLDEAHLGHQEGRARKGPKVQGLPQVVQGPEQFLEVDHTHHVVQVPLHHGDARMG